MGHMDVVKRMCCIPHNLKSKMDHRQSSSGRGDLPTPKDWLAEGALGKQTSQQCILSLLRLTPGSCTYSQITIVSTGSRSSLSCELPLCEYKLRDQEMAQLAQWMIAQSEDSKTISRQFQFDCDTFSWVKSGSRQCNLFDFDDRIITQHILILKSLRLVHGF